LDAGEMAVQLNYWNQNKGFDCDFSKYVKTFVVGLKTVIPPSPFTPG